MDPVIAAATGTTLRLWHRFEATPERVFAAWTNPDALRLWWCPIGWHPTEIEVDLRPGGKYQLAMMRESGAQLVTVRGRFLEIEPAKRLVYTWRWDGAFADMPETIVMIEFREVTGGTELALRQEVLKLPNCVQQLSGWLPAFERLALLVGTRSDIAPGGAPDRNRLSSAASNPPVAEAV